MNRGAMRKKETFLKPVIAFLLLICLLLTGCGTDASPADGPAEPGQTADASAGVPAEPDAPSQTASSAPAPVYFGLSGTGKKSRGELKKRC